MYVCVLIVLTHIAYDDIVFDGLGLPSLSQNHFLKFQQESEKMTYSNSSNTEREKDLLKIQQESEKRTYSNSSKSFTFHSWKITCAVRLDEKKSFFFVFILLSWNPKRCDQLRAYLGLSYIKERGRGRQRHAYVYTTVRERERETV